MSTIESFSWNPRRRLPIPGLRRVRLGTRTNNFGDLIGPIVVDRILQRESLSTRSSNGHGRTLFSVGSVLHFAHDGDVVWGSGINGKVSADSHEWSTLDVRAVRGPRTRDWIQETKGLEVPEVYGDPALLMFELGYPKPPRSHRREFLALPNLNDDFAKFAGFDVVSPRSPVNDVLEAIASSEFVVTSSLHGLLFAELMDVPVALLPAKSEPPFKYEDYARGTGRDSLPIFERLDDATAYLKKSRHSEPLAGWDSEPLLRAFPRDIFSGS